MYSTQIIENIKRRNQLILDKLDALTSDKFSALYADALKMGILLLFYSGHRDYWEQKKKYDDWIAGIGGKAAPPGYSWHEYKRAVDLVPIKDTGAADWDSLLYPSINILAKRYQLSWGGPRDSPHFVDKRGETLQQLRTQPEMIVTKRKRRNSIIITISLLALVVGYKIFKQ